MTGNGEIDDESALGAVVPSPEVREELEEFLRNDTSRIGEIYNLQLEGLNREEIRERFGLENSSFVWNYDRKIRAILDGDLPTSPSIVRGCARKLRVLLRNGDFSHETRATLQANLEVLVEQQNDLQSAERETEEALRRAASVEAEGVSGVYVYVLPHYLRYPYDPDSGRTLLKVGRSDRDVIQRFRNQTRTTALPEEPLLLRIYPTEDGEGSTEMERKFHRLLEAADHDRSRARTGGTEWFLTSVRFLDEVAITLGLEVREVIPADELD